MASYVSSDARAVGERGWTQTLRPYLSDEAGKSSNRGAAVQGAPFQWLLDTIMKENHVAAPDPADVVKNVIWSHARTPVTRVNRPKPRN